MTIYGRSDELVSRCIECDLAEPESLASLGGSATGLVDGILSAVTLQKAVLLHVYVILCRFLYQRDVMSQETVMSQKAVTSQKAVMLQNTVTLQKIVTSQKTVPRTNQQEQHDETK